MGRIFQFSGVTRGIGEFNITLIFASFHQSSQGASIIKPAPLMTRFVLALFGRGSAYLVGGRRCRWMVGVVVVLPST